MIYQDFYPTRPNLKREPQDRETIKRLQSIGHLQPDNTSIRTLWLLTSDHLHPNNSDILPPHLINWNLQVQQLTGIQRRRIDRAFNRLQQVIDPQDPWVTVFQIGSLREKANFLHPASRREFRWMYPAVQAVRQMEDPDLLFHQIGGYEAELILRILGWNTRLNP